MERRAKVIRRSARAAGLALAAVVFVLALPGRATAGDEFERGFRDELGRIAAHETVGVGRVVLAEILGVGPPRPGYRVHRYPRRVHRHPHRHGWPPRVRFHGPRCGHASYVRYEAWVHGPHRYERYERRALGRPHVGRARSWRYDDEDSDSDRW